MSLRSFIEEVGNLKLKQMTHETPFYSFPLHMSHVQRHESVAKTSFVIEPVSGQLPPIVWKKLLPTTIGRGTIFQKVPYNLQISTVEALQKPTSYPQENEGQNISPLSSPPQYDIIQHPVTLKPIQTRHSNHDSFHTALNITAESEWGYVRGEWGCE